MKLDIRSIYGKYDPEDLCSVDREMDQAWSTLREWIRGVTSMMHAREPTKIMAAWV